MRVWSGKQTLKTDIYSDCRICTKSDTYIHNISESFRAFALWVFVGICIYYFIAQSPFRASSLYQYTRGCEYIRHGWVVLQFRLFAWWVSPRHSRAHIRVRAHCGWCAGLNSAACMFNSAEAVQRAGRAKTALQKGWGSERFFVWFQELSFALKFARVLGYLLWCFYSARALMICAAKPADLKQYTTRNRHINIDRVYRPYHNMVAYYSIRETFY